MKIYKSFLLIGICIGILCFISFSKAEDTNGTFVATKEWQEIKEGQGIPRGLHVRINLKTGKKEAKILDENDNDDDDEDHHNHEPILLNSSSLPIVTEDVMSNNKKLQIIKEQQEISEELEELMKSLPKELPALSLEYTPQKIEEIKKKFGSYEGLRKTFNEMKEHFKSDAEIISRLMSEYKNTTEVYAKKSSASATADSGEIKVSIQMQILQHLGNLMHQYDNALWFIDSNGLQEILLPLVVNETNSFLRIEAMRVLGAIAQNNPKAQVKVFEANFGSHLTQVLLTSTKSEELSAALFAFGTLLRKFPYAQKKIFSTSGSQALVAVLSKDCDLKVKAKAATIISDMIVEQRLELSHVKDNDNLNLELQYRELHFDLWLEPHSYCETMDTLITSHYFSLQEMPDLMEYFIQAMINTKEICFYLWPQSPQLRHSLLTIKKTFAANSDEFQLELAQQLKTLMKSLYLHDEL